MRGCVFFFFQAEDGIRDYKVTGVQTCALPIFFGLPAVAEAFESIAAGRPDARAALERLPRLAAQIARRGACAHPDGALRFADSALRVFEREVELHLGGRCSAPRREPMLPTGVAA